MPLEGRSIGLPSRSEGAPADAAVTESEFAALMHAVGAPRRLVAAVSGGADSMALAFLLRRWGDPVAVVVDHGLRAGSAREAALTADRLASMRIPAQVVGVDVPPGADLGARARAARYAALLHACGALGLPDLVLAHHARDQVETRVLRARCGSGAAGLAGMPAIGWRNQARLLRPLLGVAPGRLRATLRDAGIGWVDDPGNTDPATARGALRQSALADPCPDAGPARADAEAGLARELARGVTLHPAGFARVAGRLSPGAWSALLWTLSGRAHPPASDAAARLAAAGQGTLHNILVRAGYAVRETPGASVAASGGAVWDGRFRVCGDAPGAVVEALGADAAAFRGRSGLPGWVLRRLPAVRMGGKLLAVPHLHFAAAEYCPSVAIGFRPSRPLAGARFVPAEAASGGPGDAHGAKAHHVVSSRTTSSGMTATGSGTAGIE